MSKLELGERIQCPDSVYKKKNISTWIVELIGGTNRGATIRLWEKATIEDVVREGKLPHVYRITSDKKYILLDEVHYMYFLNVLPVYKDLKTVSDIIDLAWRNR